jgi:TonB family protein
MEIICQTLIAVSLIALQSSGQDIPPSPTTQPVNPGGGGVFRVGNNVTPPVLLSKTEPQYSEEARRAKYQGKAMLYVQIDPSGEATHIRVVKSLGLGLDQRAVEAVGKWKFKPGYKEGKPVTVEATVEVNFKLLGDAWMIARENFSAAAGVSMPVLEAVPSPPKCKSADAKLALSLTVHSDGSVGDARVVDSTKPSLNHGVIDSVKTWKFVPALLEGVPQSVKGQVDVVCSVLHSR